MDSCYNMIIYDLWPYMTRFGILEVVFTALHEGIQFNRLLFEESREYKAILPENYPCVNIQMVSHDPIFVLGIRVCRPMSRSGIRMSSSVDKLSIERN